MRREVFTRSQNKETGYALMNREIATFSRKALFVQ
jgi:hypothetical protein